METLLREEAALAEAAEVAAAAAQRRAPVRCPVVHGRVLVAVVDSLGTQRQGGGERERSCSTT